MAGADDQSTEMCTDPTLESMPQENSCSDSTLGNASPSCPTSDDDALEPEKPGGKCKFNQLVISQDKRVLRFDQNRRYTERHDKEIIEVVCGYSSNLKDVKIELKEAQSPCAKHSKTDLAIINYGGDEKDVFAQNSKSIKVKSPEIKGPALGYSFYKLWPYKASVSKYSIRGETCGKYIISNVIAYPDVKWKIAFAFKYDKDAGTFKYEKCEVNFNYNGEAKTWNIKHKEKKDSGDKIDGIISGIFDFLDNLQKLMDVINKVRGKYQELTGQDFEDEKSYGWTVDYPNIELSLEWGWEEDEKTSLARYPIAFNFEFNPLIGITYKADVLGFLIEKWAGVGTIINYIRKKSERAVSLKIDFEFNGKISKKAKGNVILGQGDSSKSVNLEGSGTPLAVSIGASLTGSADLDIFIVRCGAEIKGACSVSLEFCQIGFDEDGAWTRSPVTFSGLVVTGMIYKASTAEIKNGEPGRSKKRIKDDPKSKKEKELLKVGAATWFEEKHYINKKSK